MIKEIKQAKNSKPRIEKRNFLPKKSTYFNILLIGAFFGEDALAENISGSVFFNDLRTYGNFEWRYNTNQATGKQTTSREETAENYLAGLDMTVDVFEVDPKGFGKNCRPSEYLGSTTVDKLGNFSFNITTKDKCREDRNTDPDIALKISLKYCVPNERCISVRNWNDSYTTSDNLFQPDDLNCTTLEKTGYNVFYLWHNQANEKNPIEISNDSVNLSAFKFQEDQQKTSFEDQYTQAAMVYASFVDSTRMLHVLNKIPFEQAYGEVIAVYPSLASDGRAFSAQRFDIGSPDSEWISGQKPAHEYGHIIQRRSYNGTYGYSQCGEFDYMGYPSWSANTPEYPKTSFKEGFANFVSHVSLLNYACNLEDFDDNSSHEIYGTSEDGLYYPGNISKYTCDWQDNRYDDDANLEGYGDSFSMADLSLIRDVLKNMWQSASNEDRQAGLDICSFTDFYLSTQDCSSNNSNCDLILNMAFNNNVDCGYGTPSSL